MNSFPLKASLLSRNCGELLETMEAVVFGVDALASPCDVPRALRRLEKAPHSAPLRSALLATGDDEGQLRRAVLLDPRCGAQEKLKKIRESRGDR